MAEVESSGGIGLSGALGILFIGLKLGHVIAWSWLWVLAPIWISVALAVAFVGIALLAAVLLD